MKRRNPCIFRKSYALLRGTKRETKSEVMDQTDIRITELLRGNARMTYQELGDRIGISRVAAMKRVRKLEEQGIIRGYNTYICRDDEVTMFIDIVTAPGKYDDVLEYVCTKTSCVRQVFRTTKKDHIHLTAVSDSPQNLAYLTRMIRKQCGDSILELECHAVKEVIKDVYGGIRYEDTAATDPERDNK